MVFMLLASFEGKNAPAFGITFAGPMLFSLASPISARATIFLISTVDALLLVTQTSTLVIFMGLLMSG